MENSVLDCFRHEESEVNHLDNLVATQGLQHYPAGWEDRCDVDVTLSSRGLQRAQELGSIIGTWDPYDLIFCSPYVRAQQTCTILLQGFPDTLTHTMKAHTILDYRLSEQLPGIRRWYTDAELQQKYPQEMQRQRVEGSFWYSPPGGESGLALTERVRSFLRDWLPAFEKKRVLLVAHQGTLKAIWMVLCMGSATAWDQKRIENGRLCRFSWTSQQVAQQRPPWLLCGDPPAYLEEEQWNHDILL